ncbi:MAG TPA: ABC transporter substrate-binding protein [Micropepsaceae bacterium]|jgi:NitT/TauT family transport system substrate-binding protein|nr:ABC transporter substrate-binding protein [Micropepsaceae bacterium]
MTRIRLGAGGIGFNFLPVYVAQRQGLFAQNGIEVETMLLPSVDKATAAVKEATRDLAITPPEGAIRDAAAGGPLRAVAANVNRLPLSLIAHPRFHRIEDLKGAVLGTSSLTEGTALYTMEVLRRHGLNYPGDYTFDVVGLHPARWQALQDGTIDAAVQLIPLNFIAEDAGFRNLGEVTDYIPDIAFTAVIADKNWAEQNRAAVVAFLRSLIQATAWMDNPLNDGPLLALMAEMIHADGKYGRLSLDYMREKRVFPRDLSIPDAAFAKTVELMQKAGFPASDAARARRVLDDSHRKEAAA